MHYPSVNNKSLSKIKPASFPLTAIFSCLPVFCLAVSFFLRPANLQNSLSEILSYLGSSLIPALFPFLLLGHLCVKEPVFCLLERLFSPLSLLLKQERSVPVVLFLSFLGGYPIGALLLKKLVSDGKLSPKKAGVLLCMLSYPSPSFVILLAGEILLKSKKAGLLLFASLLLGALPLIFVAFFLCRTHQKTKICGPLPSFSLSLFLCSVKEAGESILSLSFSVLSAACLMPLLELLPLTKPQIAFFSALLEVSGGIGRLANGQTVNLLLFSFLLAFGGLSVIGQNLILLQKSGIPTHFYLLSRPIYALFSLLSARLLLPLFPLSLPTGNNTLQPLSVPPTATIALLSMIAMLLFLLQEKTMVKKRK
ncbi:MAG: hypothetical protein IJC85_03570 [Oscillospiraceae bacterium]|nr:hypothetical protein [Oscillospiraceae bacterium]